MNIINYNGKEYIEGIYILNNAPVYAKGCRSSRDLIKKKNIDTIKYIFARLKENEWIVTDGKSVKFDKVFFNKSFINTIPELKINDNKTLSSNDNEKILNIILLDDNEKFKDDNGDIIEIETRGERLVNKIYFKVKDVMEGFNLENLHNTIIKTNTNYTENIDYVYLTCNLVESTKNTSKKLFLTYQGMLRVLFISRNGKTSKFIKWAVETLFTVQLSNKEQKQELVSNILGTNAKVIKEIFNADRNTLPCVYLFTLNTVGNLRKSMNIDPKYADDAIVAKYGFTKDLARRTGEHINKYNKIINVELKLKYYSYIDPQYMSNAETDIKDYMIGYEILSFSQIKKNDINNETKTNIDKEDELVIIPNKLLKMVERQYELIGKSYMGHISELITRIKDLEDKLEKQTLQHQIELQHEKHQIELQNKDLELLQYKIKFLEIQLTNKKN